MARAFKERHKLQHICVDSSRDVRTYKIPKALTGFVHSSGS